MYNIKYNTKYILNGLYIFLIIYLSSSFITTYILLGRITMILMLFVAICTMITNYYYINVNHTLLLLFLLFLSSYITIIVNDDSLYNYIILWTFMVCGYAIFLTIDFFQFIKLFNNIMTFLCAFSIITFSIFLLSSTFVMLFPKQISANGTQIYNMIFSVVYFSDIPRNYGLFWEPGAFQGYISIALFFELFIIEKLRKKNIIIYIITIITTLSTTGYIITFLTILTYLISKHSTKDKKYKFILQMLILFGISGALLFMNLPGRFKLQVFGKLKGLTMNEGQGTYVSATIRRDSFLNTLQTFIFNPLFGIGYTKAILMAINKGYNMNICTVTNWGAYFGIIWFGICNLSLCAYTKIIKGNFLVKILGISSFFLVFISEDFHRNASIFVIIFYGMDLLFKRKVNKSQYYKNSEDIQNINQIANY